MLMVFLTKLKVDTSCLWLDLFHKYLRILKFDFGSK